MWIRLPTFVSRVTPEINSFLVENRIHATQMSVCFDVSSNEDVYTMVQKGFKVGSDIHAVECDKLVIDNLRWEKERLKEHIFRCEAMIRKLQLDISQLSNRLSTYEHVLNEL